MMLYVSGYWKAIAGRSSNKSSAPSALEENQLVEPTDTVASCHHDLEAQNNLRSPTSSFRKRDQKMHHKTFSVPVSESACGICLPTQETQETQIQSSCREDPLEEELATHSGILAWETPWIKERGRLQSMGSQRVGHD